MNVMEFFQARRGRTDREDVAALRTEMERLSALVRSTKELAARRQSELITRRRQIAGLRKEVEGLIADRDAAYEAFGQIKWESAQLQQEYGQPSSLRQLRCALCRQHETVDRKDAALRAMATTVRRYRRERDAAREQLLAGGGA